MNFQDSSNDHFHNKHTVTPLFVSYLLLFHWSVLLHVIQWICYINYYFRLSFRGTSCINIMSTFHINLISTELLSRLIVSPFYRHISSFFTFNVTLISLQPTRFISLELQLSPKCFYLILITLLYSTHKVLVSSYFSSFHFPISRILAPKLWAWLND